MSHLFRIYRSSARLVRTTATQTPPAPPPLPCNESPPCNEWKTTFDSRVKRIEIRSRRMDTKLGSLESRLIGLQSRLETTMTKAVRTREILMEAARTLKDLENMIQARELAQKTDAEKASLWTIIKVAAKFSPISLLFAGCLVMGEEAAKTLKQRTEEEKRRRSSLLLARTLLVEEDGILHCDEALMLQMLVSCTFLR